MSSIFADVEMTCAKCQKKFWLTGAEQELCHRQRQVVPDRCANCRSNAVSAEMSTALATLEQLKNGGADAVLAKLMPNAAQMFSDIKGLLSQASTPIEYRRRTFWEWLRQIDLEAVQVEQKLRAGNYADRLLQQRLTLIRQVQEVAKTTYEAAQAQFDQRRRLLEAYLQQLKLEDEIMRQQALRDERIRTLQLEEARKQARLLTSMNPPPPEPAETDEDRIQRSISKHRTDSLARVAARQVVASDFYKEVHRLYDSDLEDAEKALQIREVIEGYGQDPDNLPKKIREFLEWVDSNDHEDEDEEEDEDDSSDEDEEDQW